MKKGILILLLLVTFKVADSGTCSRNVIYTIGEIKIEIEIQYVTATCYHAEAKQCNADFGHTANMSKIDLENPIKHKWIAISRDLEKKGFKLRDRVRVSGAGIYNGIWTIQDRMHKRWENKIDFLIGKSDYIAKWENVKIIKIGGNQNEN